MNCFAFQSTRLRCTAFRFAYLIATKGYILNKKRSTDEVVPSRLSGTICTCELPSTTAARARSQLA